jgi:hypothetical protein
MECFDLYGIDCEDIDSAKDIIETNLGIQMQGRSSDYIGDYYIFRIDSHRSMSLLENIDHYNEDDTEHILEPDFPMFRFILRLDGFPDLDADFYKTSFSNNCLIHFLRRTIF